MANLESKNKFNNDGNENPMNKDMKYSVDKLFPQYSFLKNKEKPVVYLDSAATSLKLASVINKEREVLEELNANVHRGAHQLSNEITSQFEDVRLKCAQYFNANRSEEFIFVRGATEGINLLSSTINSLNTEKRKTIILTEMEHHANLIPWQQLAKRENYELKFIPVNEEGELDLQWLDSNLNEDVFMLGVVHVSNTLGTVNPIDLICKKAQKVGALTVIDACQTPSILKVDLKTTDCDFWVTSAHKFFGPFGVGLLFGKYDLLEKLGPYQTGGGMIDQVTLKDSSFLPPPFRFEAGTPNVSGILSLGPAIDFLMSTPIEEYSKLEQGKIKALELKLKEYDCFENHSVSNSKLNILSFNIKGAHPTDLGMLLDMDGIALRIGHHCTQPLMKRFKIPGCVRLSLGIYNQQQDIDLFLKSFDKSIGLLGLK